MDREELNARFEVHCMGVKAGPDGRIVDVKDKEHGISEQVTDRQDAVYFQLYDLQEGSMDLGLRNALEARDKARYTASSLRRRGNREVRRLRTSSSQEIVE